MKILKLKNKVKLGIQWICLSGKLDTAEERNSYMIFYQKQVSRLKHSKNRMKIEKDVKDTRNMVERYNIHI